MQRHAPDREQGYLTTARTGPACRTLIPGYNPNMPETDEGDSFRAQVYLIVRQVPAGRVTTYGQIAAMIPSPTGTDAHEYSRIRARWVGRAMHQAPDDVPWHRVVNSQGKVSLPPQSRAFAVQRMRLEAEGIVFSRSGAVDLDRYRWGGPSPAWAEEHGLAFSKTDQSGPRQLDLFD